MSFNQTYGNNEFRDNTYDHREWSAQVMESKEDVIHRFHELDLLGRTIEDLRVIGMGYNWEEEQMLDWLDNAALWQFGKDHCFEEDVLIPDGLNIIRWAEIDEPLLIRFTDGDVLAVSCLAEGAVRMDLNSIPWDIRSGINRETFHANKLFGDMIGKEIISFRVTTRNEREEEIDSIFFGYGRTGEKVNKELRLYVDDLSYGQLELQENGETAFVDPEEIPEIINWDVLGSLHKSELYLNSADKNAAR